MPAGFVSAESSAPNRGRTLGTGLEKHDLGVLILINPAEGLRPGTVTHYRHEMRPEPVVVQATEEAVANALIANEDTTGRDGHRSPALPRQRLPEILAGTRRPRLLRRDPSYAIR